MHKRPHSRQTTVAAHKKHKAFKAEPIDSRGERPLQAPFVPRTELGRRLWRIRQRILVSGQPLLEWEGIESELLERTGRATGET